MNSFNITIKIAILLSLIYFLSIFIIPLPKTAAIPLTPTLFAYDLQLPTKPTRPAPPTSPKEQKKETAPQQQPPPSAEQPATTHSESKLTPNQPSDKPLKATDQAATIPSTNYTNNNTTTVLSTNEADDKPTESAAKQPSAQNNSEKFFNRFLNYTFYSILILAIIVCTGYLYFTTPKEKITASTKQPIKKQPDHKMHSQQPSSELITTPLLNDIKITNRSLLEQLIKYDLETYGEIRTNLDYEQPAYVEKIIRKHGGSDKNKVNRAIHLFYQNRHKK